MSLSDFGRPVPDVALEPALGVAVREFQGTGRLAAAGDAVEQHPALGAARGQRLAGPQHGLQPAHVPLRLGGKRDAQPDVGQGELLRRPRGQRQLQVRRAGADQDRRGRRQGRTRDVGRQRLVQRQVQRGRQRLVAVQQLFVQRQHQLGGKRIAHRVAHGQGGTVQPLGQRLGQAGQHGLRRLGHRLARGALLPHGQPVQADLDAGRRVAGRAAVAGVQDQQLQPPAGPLQQPAQLVRVDRVRAAAVVLQQQLAALAVPGQMDHVPAVGFFQRRPQRVPRGPVLQHPQLDGRAARLAQLADQPLQPVPFAAQVQRVQVHRQAERGQDAEAGFGAGRFRGRPRGGGAVQLVDEPQARLAERGPVLEPGQFERPEQQILGRRGHGHMNRHGRQGAVVPQRLRSPPNTCRPIQSPSSANCSSTSWMGLR